jgi:hypothetical protein
MIDIVMILYKNVSFICDELVKRIYKIITIKNKLDWGEIIILYVYKLSFIKSNYK